jgi:putative tryptophan/tyrosine transport system substrate-binding protein
VGDAHPHVRRAARPIARAGFVLLALASILVTPWSPAAQPDTRIPWIGYLANEPTPDSAPVLREVLRERGWIDGESIKVWYRYVQGKPDLYQQHADDLVRLQVRVIVAVGAPAIEAARRATKTVPIVMVSLDDPGATDTNLTGITTFAPELGPRRLELLRQIVPRLTRATVLLSAGNASATAELSATKSAAAARGVELTPVEIADESDVREALTRVGKSRPQGLLVLADAITLAHRQRVATFTSRSKLPAVFPFRDFADAGGLISYGANWTDVFRQTADLVDRLLKGARPAELGIRRASRVELIVNLRAARTLAVKVPSSLLQRADRVIE